jgi:hypothetical protein
MNGRVSFHSIRCAKALATNTADIRRTTGNDALGVAGCEQCHAQIAQIFRQTAARSELCDLRRRTFSHFPHHANDKAVVRPGIGGLGLLSGA